MTYIVPRNWISTEQQQGEVYIDIFNTTSKLSIASQKWQTILKDMETTEKGKVQIAKAFKDKPARVILWIKSDKEIIFETYHSNTDGKWDFQNEFIVTLEALEAFAPIHDYSLNIMNKLKKEFADEALSETSFLTRD